MSRFPVFATWRDCGDAGGRRELIYCNVLAGSELRFGPGLGNGVSQAHYVLNSCGQVTNECVLSCLCVPVAFFTSRAHLVSDILPDGSVIASLGACMQLDGIIACHSILLAGLAFLCCNISSHASGLVTYSILVIASLPWRLSGR